MTKRLGVTARHLRRAFTEHVGIGPKDYARTVRLQRAVRMAATSKDWGRIAVDAGYYDQAHLIGDFRELVGLTPGAFLKRPGVWSGSIHAEAAFHNTLASQGLPSSARRKHERARPPTARSRPLGAENGPFAEPGLPRERLQCNLQVPGG